LTVGINSFASHALKGIIECVSFEAILAVVSTRAVDTVGDLHRTTKTERSSWVKKKSILTLETRKPS